MSNIGHIGKYMRTSYTLTMKIAQRINNLIIIVLFFWSNIIFASDQQTKQFISIADIHFNPLQGCERFNTPCPLLKELQTTHYTAWDDVFMKYVGRDSIKYYEDTNYVLLQSTIKQLQHISKEMHPEFVLVLGDFLDHHLEKNYKKWNIDNSRSGYTHFVKLTMQYLTYKLNQAFPNIDIYPVLGNVDTDANDYKVQPNGDFLNDLSIIWSGLIKNNQEKQQFLAEFKKAAYYTIDIHPTGKLILLDTILFSPRSQNKVVKQAAYEELDWLEDQLKSAKEHHQSVLIICHIPIGIDFYFSSSIAYKIIKNFWKTEYTKRFLSLVKEYSDSIVAILPGHIHIDLMQFTIESKDNKFIPIIFTPSISPIFGNNPAIKEFSYLPNTFKLQSFERYYYPISDSKEDWRKGPRYNGIYQSNCHYCYLKDVVIHLVANNYLMHFFTRFYTGNQGVEQNGDLYSYWCSIYSNDMKTYKNCIN